MDHAPCTTSGLRRTWALTDLPIAITEESTACSPIGDVVCSAQHLPACHRHPSSTLHCVGLLHATTSCGCKRVIEESFLRQARIHGCGLCWSTTAGASHMVPSSAATLTTKPDYAEALPGCALVNRALAHSSLVHDITSEHARTTATELHIHTPGSRAARR